jgi:hypothetical protein
MLDESVESLEPFGLPLTARTPGEVSSGHPGLGLAERAVKVGTDASPGQVMGQHRALDGPTVGPYSLPI